MMLDTKENPPLKFTHEAPFVWNALRKLKRTGWVESGVKNPETVEEHTIALRAVAFLLEGLRDFEKEALLDMLEVHDWPEAVVGDEIVLSDDAQEKKTLLQLKFEKEQKAMESICSTIDGGEKILALWLRFETGDDSIAVLAREIDKYQAIEKALEYEIEQDIPLFNEFLAYSIKDISHPALLEKVANLESEWEQNRKNKTA